jgi:ceramide glucosyltransferase
MLVFYFFAAIVIWLGILSLRGGTRFAAYVRSEAAEPLANFTPYVSVLAPCRGLDSGLKQNLAALFQQDYPAYEIVFLSDRADDPSLGLITELIEARDQTSRVAARIVIAGPATDSGQKVHNLRVGVAECEARSEVFVFVDTDARPQADWLRSLVAPLVDEAIGVASGYRWFVPIAGGLASHLRACGMHRSLQRWARVATRTFVGAAQPRFADLLSQSSVSLNAGAVQSPTTSR